MKIKFYEVNGIEFSMKASGLPHVKCWEDSGVMSPRHNRLAKAPIGSGHDKFLRGITVHLVINSYLKWFDEFNTYNFVWDVSSTSVMHTFPHASEEEIKALPMGYEYDRAFVLNYATLKTMYAQRKNHRLSDWRVFCDWIKGLPCSHWITGEEP